ncbi:MAG TPA: hypothetical protein VMT76_06135 [Puia sp.]|nr:hypothetical protein [Puia sp.]
MKSSLVKPIVASLIASCTFFTSRAAAASSVTLIPGIEKKNDNKTEEKTSFSVSLSQMTNPDIVRVTIFKPELKSLLVTLKDKDGSILYSFWTKKSQKRVAKDYDFLGADEGVYTLQVSDGKSIVSKQIRLQHIKIQEESKISIE